jgi:hypothetical protein
VRKFSLVAQGAAPAQRLSQSSPAPIRTASGVHCGDGASTINAYAKRRERDKPEAKIHNKLRETAMFDLNQTVIVITEKGVAYEGFILARATGEDGRGAYKIGLEGAGFEQPD